MSWWDIVYVIIVAIVINFSYRKGVKAGIRHALMVLKLDTIQTEILNNELKKDSHDLAMTAGKEYSKNETLLN